MHLRHRRGCERRWIEFIEQLLERTREILLDDPAYLGNREWTHILLQENQLRDDFRWQLVGPRAHYLPDLYEGGAQPFEREAQGAAERRER